MSDIERIQEEIQNLKERLKDARSRIEEIERLEREKNKKRCDIISRIENKRMLDDTEIRLVAECADEIIAVLYKYKVLCSEHQNIDYSEFLYKREECNG